MTLQHDPPSALERNSVKVLSRYSLAVATTALAVWARFLLQPWLGEECPFSLFYLSVLVTGGLAGTGPALLSLALGSFAASHFFIRPHSSLYIEGLADFLQLKIYVLVSCVAVSLYHRIGRQKLDAERRSSENEQLSQSLREANARKDEFLALLAHELRNPLAPVRSGLSLLRHDPSPDRAERICQMMQRHTDHLVQLTDDLLDVSRFCRGVVSVDSRRMNLGEVIDNAVEMTASLFEAKHHRLHVLADRDSLWVNGDAMRLTQLIGNLLSNAAKYTPEGGRVSLQAEHQNGLVTVAVVDNGIGLPSDALDRIFEPFVQINMSFSRDYSGLGLGLTIASRLAELHGGRLIASSPGPGLGSRFTLELPAAAAVMGDEPHEFSAPERRPDDAWNPLGPVSCGATGRRSRILLVDDNVDAAQILGELLQLEGYELTVLHDGFAALETAARVKPDLIILDIGLPGMDGFEVARRLRRSPDTASATLIALSGWGAEAHRQQGEHVGFDEYLVKPITFTRLLHTIQRHVGSCPASSEVLSPPIDDSGDDPFQAGLHHDRVENTV